MKAILEFNLPDEKDEFDSATRGSRYLACLEMVRNLLREYRKYKSLKPDAQEIVDEIEKEFFHLTEDVWYEL